ncbi:MAG: hypothetical protein IIA91_00115 [Chloroflexi bacterium]|nr:hypothetical protein [Chloroflexota bacterium]
MSDETEATDAERLAATVAEPVDVIVYEGDAAHGVQLLANPRAKLAIRDWLAANLALEE